MFLPFSLPIRKWNKWKHLSILTSEFPSNFFGILSIGSILSIIVCSVCLNVFFDPYFVFRKTAFEPRLVTIDTHQRFTKGLQVITRQPKIVLLGSSRVYRGFDIQGDMYNMGISSLMLTEAAAYVDHIANFTRAHTIVLGLDFWMFDEVTLSYEKWDPHTGTIASLLRSFLKALFDTKVTFQVMQDYFRGNILSSPEGWNYEGFFRTAASSKEEVEAKLKAYKEYFSKTRIQLNQIVLLEGIIKKCKSNGIKLYVYISPLHPTTREVYEHISQGPSFTTWTQKIRSICQENNVGFKDFSDFLTDSPPLVNGSDNTWLDYSHFQPSIGQVILKSLGLTHPSDISHQSGK